MIIFKRELKIIASQMVIKTENYISKDS